MDHFGSLPLDIVLLISQFLDVPSFIALTQTCKQLANDEIANYPLFWRESVRSTFRIPNQPVVTNDGLRWKKLYKRLQTEARPYTWGSNGKGNLGHSFELLEQISSLPEAQRYRAARAARLSSWPREVAQYNHLGIVSDLQAGGWSTTFLTAKGGLYSTGVMDGMRFSGHPPRPQRARHVAERLEFPPGYIHPAQRYDRETAIKQFSAGRSHVLGLSDAGRIWSWNDIGDAALNVKLLDIDLNQAGNLNGSSKVKKVVAGWNKSAALIQGRGIVVWDPVYRGRGDSAEEDTMLVLETATVPQSGFERSSVAHKASPQGRIQDEDIGEVLDFILLEDSVIFNTHHGRVFASWILWSQDEQTLSPLFEIQPHTHYTQELSESENDADTLNLNFTTDVQGTFRTFAIFTRQGEVLTGTQDLLRSWIDDPEVMRTSPMSKIPALQNTGVIALAFGDHHFHALHTDGFITSYGTESQACGSLGLGGHRDPEGRLRGIRYGGLGGDGKLVTQAYTTGRRVWFEPEKREWIKYLASGGRDPQEAVERMRMAQDPEVMAELSEWIEQEGNAWAERFAHPAETEESARSSEDDSVAPSEVPKDVSDDDALAPYFALSVTAAGWHSGALVLVNEESASRIRANCMVSVPNPPSDPTTTQSQEGSLLYSILTNTVNNVAWFLGLTSPATAPQPLTNPVTYQDNFPPPRNPRIRFPPHRPVPTRHNPNQRPQVQPVDVPQQQQGVQTRASLDPLVYGAQPDAYHKWRWADDSFPRLKLSDGTDMPGTVEFSDWRLGRPEWDMGFTAYS